MNNSILNKILSKDIIKRYSIFALSLLISAINYNLFILPCNIVLGGTSGIATILNYAFSLDPSLVLFLLYFILLIVSYIYLDIEDTKAALFITIVYPLMVKVTEGLVDIFLFDKSNILLFAIIGGILNGATNGVVYKLGLNTGGIGILSKVIANKHKKSVSRISLIMNIIIVLIGWYFLGINIVLYSCITLYITDYMGEKVLVGISNNKAFYIISKHYDKINSFITDVLHHDATIFNVKGKYNDNSLKMVFVVVPTSEYFILKEQIKMIDNKAFVTITDTYEIKGQDVKINTKNY